MLHTFRAGVFCQISVFALCRRALGGSLGALRSFVRRGSLVRNGAGGHAVGGRIACGCKDGIVDLALSQRGGLRGRGCAVGRFGFVYSAGTMEAYEILVHNEKYSNSFWFKVKRKAKLKIDKW